MVKPFFRIFSTDLPRFSTLRTFWITHHTVMICDLIWTGLSTEGGNCRLKQTTWSVVFSVERWISLFQRVECHRRLRRSYRAKSCDLANWSSLVSSFSVPFGFGRFVYWGGNVLVDKWHEMIPSPSRDNFKTIATEASLDVIRCQKWYVEILTWYLE